MAIRLIYAVFMDRLRAFRVLDPPCGSGNFIYLALLALKDLELRVSIPGYTPARPSKRSLFLTA